MKISRIPGMESRFLQNGEGNHTKFDLTPFSIPIKGDPGHRLNGMLVSRKDKYTGFFIREDVPKEKIVIHYTAGNIKSDIDKLAPGPGKPRISVAFVIARDGTIYRMFSSKDWAFHLGPRAIGGNRTQSRKSIGIELSNYGFLHEKDGFLETCYSRIKDRRTGKIGPKDIYCSLRDTREYIRLEKPFREKIFFVDYTNDQYESLILLLRYLTVTYNIPRAFLDEPERYEATQKATTFKGILTHVNFRSRGKWDIGRAFDWERVIQGTQVEQLPSPRSIVPIPVHALQDEAAITSALPVDPNHPFDPEKYGEDGPEEPEYFPDFLED